MKIVCALLACGWLFAGCDVPAALAGDLALELAFEDSCEPRTAAELTLEEPEAGIEFQAGIEGRSLRFDGSGAELKFHGLDRLGIASAMTLEFFVNAEDWQNPYEAGSALESLVSHMDIFSVALNPHDWTLHARVTPDEHGESVKLMGGRIQPGSWHHVALVFDGEQAELWQDGKLAANAAARGQLRLREGLGMVIGTWFGRNQAFSGRLDSLRLWKRALLAQEIAERAALLPPPVEPPVESGTSVPEESQRDAFDASRDD